MAFQPREKERAGDASGRFVYLLIVWQERPATSNTPAIWRFSLENVRTGQRRGFGSLKALIDFFQQWGLEDPRDQRS